MQAVEILLDDDFVERINRPVNGQGGFQDLLRLLQNGLSGNTLIIDSEEVAERILRYADQYGEGGFENRLRGIADQIRSGLSAATPN